jgi:hypothetical protein
MQSIQDNYIEENEEFGPKDCINLGYSLMEKDYDEVDLQNPLEVNVQQTYENAPVVDEDEFFDLFAKEIILIKFSFKSLFLIIGFIIFILSISLILSSKIDLLYILSFFNS